MVQGLKSILNRPTKRIAYFLWFIVKVSKFRIRLNFIQSMAMELHVVCFKEEYETLELALRRPNGVTVLVYFCKVMNSRIFTLNETHKLYHFMMSKNS